MLYSLQKLLSPKSRSVKTGVALPLILGALSLTPMTASALDITVTEYNVRFERTAVQSIDGIEGMYETLEQKAKEACRLGRAVNDAGEYMTKKDCASDLLEQFVQSASIDALTDYHSEKVINRK